MIISMIISKGQLILLAYLLFVGRLAIKGKNRDTFFWLIGGGFLLELTVFLTALILH